MKQELGPIQLRWIESLEANPEQQVTGSLGYYREEEKAWGYCCLGKGLEILGKVVTKQGVVMDAKDDKSESRAYCNAGILEHHYADLGLYGPHGDTSEYFGPNKEFKYLAKANDGGMSWPQIAAAMRANPSIFFSKSV